jgi:hypothetical protein
MKRERTKKERTISETGGLKDGLQEVPKGGKWWRRLLLPRKHLFASERHLLPTGNANRL